MTSKSQTKNKKNSNKPSGQTVAPPKNSKELDEGVEKLRKAKAQIKKDGMTAFVNSKVTSVADGSLEVLDITSVQNTIQKGAIEFLTHAASDGQATANFFLSWTAKQKKRIAVVIGKSECRIWSADEIETWVDASGRDVVVLYVSEDALREGRKAILQQIGHGVTHIVNRCLAVSDTSNNGRHKDEFQKRAKSLGLVCSKVKTNKQWIVSGLTPELSKWLEGSTVKWDEIIAWAKAKKPSNSAKKSATGSQTSSADKAKKAKAQAKKKDNESKASKYESLMDRVERVYCPVKAHHSKHGETYVQKGKVPHVCPVSVAKDDPSKRCLKIMVVPTIEARPRTAKA